MGILNWDMRMLGTVVVSILLYLSPAVLGHGNMVWPMPWWDVHEAGAYWDQNGHDTHVGCGVLDLPHTEFEDHSGRKPDCMNFWFSNNVLIPGKATIPDEMGRVTLEIAALTTVTHLPWERTWRITSGY